MSAPERLKFIRKQLDLTQKEIAISVGLNQANVRDLESGKVKISTLHALALEYVHKINSKWLLEGQGDPLLTKKDNDDGLFLESIIEVEKAHLKLVRDFIDKETAKEVNQKLVDLEKLSERTYKKVVGHITEVWETVTTTIEDYKFKQAEQKGRKEGERKVEKEKNGQ